MSNEARAYLNAALDTIQRVTLRADTLPWRRIRDSAFVIAAGAQRPIDTYTAIDWALRRANKHSFLQARVPGAVSTMLPERVAYVHVPQRGGSSPALPDSLHRAVASFDSAGACGWIVDLRANGGGNMWLMLAGIGPLLGDTIVGSFGTGPNADRWHYRSGVSAILKPGGRLDTASRVTVPPVELRNPDAPIAVLIDSGTGSSGEAVAIAFQGRPNTRTFGSPSAGFATVNRGAQLPDHANMVVTVGYNADRRGVVYVDQIRPDVRVELPSGWPSPTDRVSAAAAEWLREQPGCTSP